MDGGGVLYRVFIADTDNDNIKMLSELLLSKHDIVPDIWQNGREYLNFLESESAIVFIRVDNCFIPSLELTLAAISRSTDIHVVWMAESDAYAVDAFRYGAEAYLLLPATAEAWDDALESLILAKK